MSGEEKLEVKLGKVYSAERAISMGRLWEGVHLQFREKETPQKFPRTRWKRAFQLHNVWKNVREEGKLIEAPEYHP